MTELDTYYSQKYHSLTLAYVRSEIKVECELLPAAGILVQTYEYLATEHSRLGMGRCDGRCVESASGG